MPRLDILRNLIHLLNLRFLTRSLQNFFAMCKHIAKKFCKERVEKPSNFSNKAGYARNLLKQRRIFFASLFASIFIHVVEVFFLQHQSLWFASPRKNSQVTIDVSTLNKKTRDQVLKTAFATKAYPQGTKTQKTPEPHLESTEWTHSWKLEEFTRSPTSLQNFPKISFLKTPHTPDFPLPPHKPIALLDHLPKDLMKTSVSQEISPSPFSPSPLDHSFKLRHILNEITASPHFHISKETSSWQKETSPPALLALPQLPNIPSLAELQTTSHSDSFETEFVFLEQEDGSYLFALTLIPREDLNLTPLKQNYIFLIDHSNSIQKERLFSTKNAVRRAVEELSTEDRFNIITFDRSVQKLSSQLIPASPDSFQKANAFLEKIELGNFFSQTDLYKPLFLITPSLIHDDELYTAILISDGESLSKKEVARSLLSDWTKDNQAQISLYVLAMENDSSLQALEALSNANRGKTITSSTNRGLKRKLLKLMKTIHTPLSKNLSCKAIALSPNTQIEILPQNPPLFLNEPYVILGKTNSLNDFILFVQGRLNGQWLHIKKTISFLNAKKAPLSLKKEWAMQSAIHLHRQYLLDHQMELLVKANEILKTYDSQVIFE